MKGSAILLGVKIVDIALQVPGGQNINGMGEYGRYCEGIAVVLDPEALCFAITISRRDLMQFEGRGVRIEGLGSATTQQSLLALKCKSVCGCDWTEYDDAEPLICCRSTRWKESIRVRRSKHELRRLERLMLRRKPRQRKESVTIYLQTWRQVNRLTW
jgi:hypothetical protein